MGYVDHAGKRLGGSGVRRDQLGAVKDPDTMILHDDIDMVAHQSMRDAIPDRVGVHERGPTAAPGGAARGAAAGRGGAAARLPQRRPYRAVSAAALQVAQPELPTTRRPRPTPQGAVRSSRAA